jgi:hypothetical protein
VTSRVFECQRRPIRVDAPPRPRRARSDQLRGVKVATVTAVLLVPLAGAAEPPQGWTASSLAALGILLLAVVAGTRAPWGWLGLLAALAGLALPRGPLPALGPGLFVATALCGVLWFANRSERRRADSDRPPPGSREREAQQEMGLSGERSVAQVLARDLPEAFVLINGLALPRGGGDIDHLVVGPTGVFLVETKTMAGRIECAADGTWRRTRLGRAGASYPAYIGNPSNQVLRNIFAARNCLRWRLPRLFAGTPLWLEGLVVFAHPRTELAAGHSRVPAVRLEEAVARICGHVPQRGLEPREVEEVVDALLLEGRERGQQVLPASQSAQALVELALALPMVLALLFGTIALSRVVQAQTAVVAVAHEAARAGALAAGPDDAVDRMRQRADLVAPGLGLDPRAVLLDWDVSTFARVRDRGHVMAIVRYAVDLRDLPLVGWVTTPVVRAEHVEWIDPFRSGIPIADETNP